MPAAEIDITTDLVRALLRSQHLDLAELELVEVANGWDNIMFALGDELMVRLPRREVAAVLIENEQRWLPGLASSLPLPIPAPVRVGVADTDFPWPWSILPWFDGKTYHSNPPSDPGVAASKLGAFIGALQRPVVDAPDNPYRGCPIADHDQRVLSRIKQLRHSIDAPRVSELWRDLRMVREWDANPMLLHGDLHPLNALTHRGELSAVIDFGDITSGDPAADYLAAWLFFDTHGRESFRSALDECDAVNDEDTWQRGRAAATSWCLAVIAFSADNPALDDISRRGLDRVLNET